MSPESKTKKFLLTVEFFVGAIAVHPLIASLAYLDVYMEYYGTPYADANARSVVGQLLVIYILTLGVIPLIISLVAGTATTTSWWFVSKACRLQSQFHKRLIWLAVLAFIIAVIGLVGW